MTILTERYEDAGDFYGLRSEYRKESLRSLRERERIPVPELIDGRWMYMGADGKHHTTATGIKGPSIAEVEEFWGGTPAFEIPSNIGLGQEVKDLSRFSDEFVAAEKVSHGQASDPNPDFTIADLSDSSVDQAIQEYVSKHE